MRLSQILSNRDFWLTEPISDKTIPQEAILSHTWRDKTRELNFEDMEGGSPRDKGGYEKIEFCSKQATRDGLQYLWRAKVCYADVSISKRKRDGTSVENVGRSLSEQ
ncbi:uncharacterized protein Z519_03048 [Cladophialophora bantiana CBS 173.52]|uniref:Uncharacterized protein n=1 Tax=Cladophialophora bantiana (strain ATCC 10958 / CBS 173.52 / CDC B-1940 / NIH 8579) TaxID=1442370 RepID=A0A0D2GBS8_CLAB1|nr:uncharacterized protein Z519_03048 [Cladophialophora bantiana CBS 173.52]KIW95982.1 hypothetical protein Z519_03048 [Cladophialophora bantiana CBS 173.52]